MLDKTTGVALWAYKLEFTHPTTKEHLEFESKPEIKGIWNILQKC